MSHVCAHEARPFPKDLVPNTIISQLLSNEKIEINNIFKHITMKYYLIDNVRHISINIL